MELEKRQLFFANKKLLAKKIRLSNRTFTWKVLVCASNAKRGSSKKVIFTVLLVLQRATTVAIAHL